MKQLSREEHRALAAYVKSVSAIDLDDSKMYLMEGRLSPVARDLGCETFADLLARAQADVAGSIRRRIIDSITTNETLFFRDSAPFDLLRHKLLPDLADIRLRTRSRQPIRIWSAACSTGQEVYSIAIVLKEVLGGSGIDARILGTDISNQAVSRASRGVYNHLEISRGLEQATLARYFVRTGDNWQVRDELRAYASFRQFNLMDSFAALGRFDIIFCRNVAIYFSLPDRMSMFSRMAAILEPEGALLVGSMESLTGVCPQLRSHQHLRTIYYRLDRPGAVQRTQ